MDEGRIDATFTKLVSRQVLSIVPLDMGDIKESF